MYYVVDIFESIFGEARKTNEDTGQIAFDCPLCDDGGNKGNLEINYQKGVFKCWSCADINHMQGKIPYLLKRFGSPKNIRDYNLFKPEFTSTEDKEHENIQITLPEGYKKLSQCTSKDFKYDLAMYYLKERGITDEIIEEFNIGYTYKGKYHNRIIIPSYDVNGRLNYFIARWFSKEINKIKYLNPIGGVEAELKQSIIFNEEKINWDATIYLVEGAYDHIVTPNSIPLLGKDISDLLLEKLHEKAKAYIVVLLDSDAYDNAIELYKKLNFGNLRDRIKLCVPPENYDPSKVFEKAGSEGVIMLLRKSKKVTDNELY